MRIRLCVNACISLCVWLPLCLSTCTHPLVSQDMRQQWTWCQSTKNNKTNQNYHVLALLLHSLQVKSISWLPGSPSGRVSFKSFVHHSHSGASSGLPVFKDKLEGKSSTDQCFVCLPRVVLQKSLISICSAIRQREGGRL